MVVLARLIGWPSGWRLAQSLATHAAKSAPELVAAMDKGKSLAQKENTQGGHARERVGSQHRAFCKVGTAGACVCAESQEVLQKGKFSADPQPHVVFNDPGDSAASMS